MQVICRVKCAWTVKIPILLILNPFENLLSQNLNRKRNRDVWLTNLSFYYCTYNEGQCMQVWRAIDFNIWFYEVLKCSRTKKNTLYFCTNQKKHKGLGLRKVLKKVLKKALKKILLTQKSTQKSKCTFLSTQKRTQ